MSHMIARQLSRRHSQPLEGRGKPCDKRLKTTWRPGGWSWRILRSRCIQRQLVTVVVKPDASEITA